MANVELLDKVVEYIEAHTEEHSQGHWGVRDASCGTTMCFAGHASVTLSGDTPIWRDGGEERYDVETEKWITRPYEYFDTVQTPGGPRLVDLRAAELLGLDDEDATALFFEANNLYDIKACIARIKY